MNKVNVTHLCGKVEAVYSDMPVRFKYNRDADWSYCEIGELSIPQGSTSRMYQIYIRDGWAPIKKIEACKVNVGLSCVVEIDLNNVNPDVNFNAGWLKSVIITGLSDEYAEANVKVTKARHYL